MRLEEIVSSFIMFIVSGLVLIGFTIAWYTNTNLPAVTGMTMSAAEMGDVKVALTTPNGSDITELEGDARYVDIGMEAFSNLAVGKLAPGTHGKLTFYVTPTKSSVASCTITPMLRITQDGSIWYPATESDESADSENMDSGADSDVIDNTDATAALVQLYDIAQQHLQFFYDEAMTQPVDVDNPILLEWMLEERLTEKKVEIYWKWHYEYPFSAEEETTLSDAEKKDAIAIYDEEDRKLGNNVSGMKFYFTFVAQ